MTDHTIVLYDHDKSPADLVAEAKPTHDEVIAYTVALDADLDRLIARYDRELRVSQENTLDELIYDTTLALRSIATKAKVSNLANRAVLERHKERPFNWTTDQAIGMFSEAFPEPPQLPRCVTCRYENFPCPTYSDVFNKIVEVMG